MENKNMIMLLVRFRFASYRLMQLSDTLAIEFSAPSLRYYYFAHRSGLCPVFTNRESGDGVYGSSEPDLPHREHLHRLDIDFFQCLEKIFTSDLAASEAT